MTHNLTLRPKLLNIPLASCFLINLDFLLSHIAHFDYRIVLLLLVFKTLRFMFSGVFLWLFYFFTLDSEMALLRICDFKTILIILSILIFLPSSIRLMFSVSPLWLFIILILFLILDSVSLD